MLKKLLFLSFIEGAVVMTAELCGAKLLAPVFGSSLYVWASVMGITLAALACGYFFGGLLSEKTKDNNALFSILSVAALFVILMPALSYYLIPRISYLPFLPAVVFGTIILLFFPVFFLGASSPLFISFQSSTSGVGRVSGTVYAISTAGGISATFLCGFYLIPGIGLTACLTGFGAILFISNLIVFKFLKPFQLLLFSGFIYLNVQFSLKRADQLFVSESMLGHLEVLDLVNEKKETVRILKINNIVQSEMNTVTKQSVSEYIRLLDTLIEPAQTTGNALVLGLGGGLNANLLVSKNYKVDGVELDDRIISVAKKYFYLDKNVNPVFMDARYFLNHCQQKYDVVLIDIFKAEEQPSHVLTVESLARLKHNLNTNAMVFINWHGYISGSKGLGTSVLYNTLLNAGFFVTACSKSANENYRNVIFVAGLKKLSEQPYALHESIAATSLLNTDNLPLLEKYNAEANKTWRINYLRYYQYH